MALPRFLRLPPSRRDDILDAAAEEFSVHGYGDASIHRFMDRASLSKSTAYTYFDGKADLWSTLLESVRGHAPREGISWGETAAGFWTRFESLFLAEFEAHCASRRSSLVMKALALSAREPGLSTAERGASEMVTMLRDGQRAGAVRCDLPEAHLLDLLVSVTVLGRAWVCSSLWPPDAREPDVEAGRSSALQVVDLFRRTLSP